MIAVDYEDSYWHENIIISDGLCTWSDYKVFKILIRETNILVMNNTTDVITYDYYELRSIPSKELAPLK